MPGRSPTWLTQALVSFHHLVYWALVTCQTRSSVYARLQWHAKRVPPRVPGTFRFPFGRIRYMDARSLAHQFAEIFVDRGYEVTGLGTTPRIIDCGGNIGLSTIWFRLHYPGAVITVFEADPNIAEMLTWNLRSCGVHYVEVVQAAVGAHSGIANFLPDNSDGGHVGEGNGLTVPLVRLADRLHEPVDILKIDIEGSEFSLIGDLCDSGRISLVKHLICEVHGHKLVQEQLGEIWSALTHQGFCLAIGWALTVPTAAPGRDPTPFPGLRSARYHLHLYGWKPSP